MPAAKTLPNSILRLLPSVDELRRCVADELLPISGDVYLTGLARRVIDDIRKDLHQHPGNTFTRADLLAKAESRLNHYLQREQSTGIRRVINATGVIIHTNLGRSQLSENARQLVAQATGWCSIEYDIESGKRGKRSLRVENLITELTGAESALVVNNCAAAAFFVLSVFAPGGEVIISRGELVEIGGDFRVPDVLTQAGANLREVGTTNRTKLSDYENAIDDATRMILRVHPSNYRIVGFTEMPGLRDLVKLARRKGLLFYEDLGSGALVDLTEYGLAEEPAVRASIDAGVDVLTFSGDKLLGGPQAGIIAGKAKFVEKLRKHPLYRALRVDKLTTAALEATLVAYRGQNARSEIPVLRMLSMGKGEIEQRAKELIDEIREMCGGSANSDLKFEICDGYSAVGGGAAPAVSLETKLIAIAHKTRSAQKIEKMLRNGATPIITRIVGDRVMIDLRTVSETEQQELAKILSRAFEQNPA